MTDLPQPMTPSDCDLRGLPYMPLHGERLIDSDLFFESTGDEFKAAVALWWASWKQVPAASLPDNDRVLAGLARVVDAKKWAKVRDMALKNWTKCSDGRLYHPVVAEMARAAWDERQDFQSAKANDTERKRAEREERRALFVKLKAAGVHLPWNTPMAELRAKAADCPAPVTDLSTGQAADCPAPVTAKKRREGKGIKKDSVASAPPDATGQSSKPAKGAEPWKRDELLQALWSASTDEMRKRAKSQGVVWPEWRRAQEFADPANIVKAMSAYRKHDPDVERTGGPGLHIWLKSRTFDQYLPSSSETTVSADRWRIMVDMWKNGEGWGSSLGPEPGKPGCLVPPELLVGLAAA